MPRARRWSRTSARISAMLRAFIAAGAMNARSIAEILAEVRLHRLARGIAQRRGGVVIEINHRRSNLNPLDIISQKVLRLAPMKMRVPFFVSLPILALPI